MIDQIIGLSDEILMDKHMTIHNPFTCNRKLHFDRIILNPIEIDQRKTLEQLFPIKSTGHFSQFTYNNIIYF